MTFAAAARFRCDGCHVDSEPIELMADILQATTPERWMRVETITPEPTLDVRTIKHYCPRCAALVTTYLNSRNRDAHA